MNYCEVHTGGGPVTSPDDPRYRPCGEPACIKEGGTWMCAECYDMYVALNPNRDLIYRIEEL
jgi:hypothetical protein